MKSIAQNAPHGQIFDHTEAIAVLRGRELIRQSLETVLQEQIDDFEKKTSLCWEREEWESRARESLRRLRVYLENNREQLKYRERCRRVERLGAVR